MLKILLAVLPAIPTALTDIEAAADEIRNDPTAQKMAADAITAAERVAELIKAVLAKL